jgi:hypothetical protein
MAAIRVELRKIGEDFKSVGEHLTKGDPGNTLHDFGILAGQAESAGRLSNRYSELLSDGQSRQAEVARFSPEYPPLEFSHGD